MDDVIEGEAVEHDEPTSTEMVVMPPSGAILSGDDPDEIIANASRIATSLTALIEKQGLAVDVGGRRKHVEVSGWQSCGAMLAALGGQPLHAETVWARPLSDPGREDVRAWEACVEVRTPAGVVVGRAEAMCSRSESKWARRDEFAIRSMAETRAESRAYRRAIGWIVHMAGFNATPAEEMPDPPPASWATEEAGTATKRKALDALNATIGHRETAVEYVQALTERTGVLPDVIAKWLVALPQFIEAGSLRAQQDAGPEEEKP